MKPKADFDKIIDSKGKLIGVLNYNLMIPVKEELIQKVDLKIMKSDTPATKHYKNLCIDEKTWCIKHQETICNKANVLYELCTTDSKYKGKVRCVDFKKLEGICDKYKKS